MEDALKQIQQLASATGAVSIRKLRRKRQKTIVSKLLSDYASNSTLHGLRYVAAKDMKLFEKIFWLTTFLISIAVCGFYINNVYIKWRSSPVIITVSERLVSVGSVPFPSITICPQIKCKPSVYNVSANHYKMNKMIDENQSLDAQDKEMYEDILFICGEEFLEMQGETNSELITNRSYSNVSMVETIKKVSPRIYDYRLILECRLNNSACKNMLKHVLTSEGVCFNINGLAADEIFNDSIQPYYKYTESDQPARGWSYVDGYNDSESDPYPRRGSENGANPDLQLILQTDSKDRDIFCNPTRTGFKIFMSHPADLPQSSMYYYAAIEGQLSSLAVSVHVLNISETLHSYTAQDRQCYFPDDWPLRYFKIYTVSNCRAECLSNYTYQRCGCVGFYMPHENGSRICTINSRKCMEEANNEMAAMELRLKLHNQLNGCRCLPACYSVEYDAEILKTEFKISDLHKRFWAKYKFVFNDSRYQFSKIDVYFKKPEFVSMRRSELFGLTDFIANIGGLLGVFLGFSFLSVVEIIYFFTLKIGFLLKRDLKNEKKNLKMKQRGLIETNKY